MKTKKVVYIIDCGPERGGAPISTILLAKGICKLGGDYSVHVIMPKCVYQDYADGVIFHEIECFNDYVPFMLLHPLQWWKLCNELEQIINDIKPDIIHCHMPNVGMAIGLLRARDKISKKILLVYTDREHVAYLQWYHRVRYLFFISRNYDAMVTLSEASETYWNRKNITTYKIYNTAGPLYESLCRCSNKTNDPLKIIFVGRMVDDKDWPLSLQVISKMRDKDIKVVMSYFNSSQELKVKMFQNQVLACNSNVRFIFNASGKELKQLYRDSDILVMTSKRESFGRTAVEAMSQKCVVIGTNVGGLPEVIGKKENILDRNVEDFVKRINEYKDVFALEEDKEFFFERYHSFFSNESNIKKNLEVYQRGELSG